MSSPPLNNLDHEDYEDNIPFHSSDDLWKLLEDDNTFEAVEDFHINDGLDPIPDILNQENSILPIGDHDNTNSEWDSYMFLEQENSAVDEPVIDKGSLESCRNEECNMSLSNKSHDTSGSSDPSTFLDQQESSALEPSINTQLLHNILNYDEMFSNCGEGSSDTVLLGEAEGCSGSALPLESSMLPEKEASAVASTLSNDKALLEKQLSNAKKKEKSHTTIEEHNAKERVRRMKLYSTYLSLGALLPDSQSKKKRSAPAIIDRALEYIPELENEIEKLTLKKNNVLSTSENKQTVNQNAELEDEGPTVLVQEVKKGEVIIQIICSLMDEKTVLSKVLQNLEADGMGIISVSTLQVCERRVSYNLHIQMNKDSLATDYIADLREDVISWFL